MSSFLNLLLCPSTRGRAPDSSQASSRPSHNSLGTSPRRDRPREFYRQSECEHGTLAHPAGGRNASPKRLDNRFRYWQAHAGALDPMSLSLASIEFLEDLADFLFFDPRPLVRDTETIELVLSLCRDPDRLT